MAKKEFAFDPSKQHLVATRDFTRGSLVGTKGNPVEGDGLTFDVARQLVEKAKVAKVENKPTKTTTSSDKAKGS